MTHIKGHTNVLQPFGRHKFNFLNQKCAGTWAHSCQEVLSQA